MNKDVTNLEEQIQDSTTVGQIDINIDELFGNPGAENIMIPENGNVDTSKPKTIFSTENIDTSFLDNNPTTAKEVKSDFEYFTRPKQHVGKINRQRLQVNQPSAVAVFFYHILE